MKFKQISYSEFQITQKHPLKDFTELVTNIPKPINVTNFV